MFGYCDLLYMDIGFLTKESDVSSFGVVLFEVLCGRLCIANYDDGRRFLSNLAQIRYEENKIDTIVLECLRDQISPDCLAAFSEVAYQCVQRDRKKRPLVDKIVKQLETAFGYQVECMIEKKKRLIRSRIVYPNEQKLKSKAKSESIYFENMVKPPSIELGDMSSEELKAYDGKDPKKPLLMAIRGHIYDVSSDKRFYGPGGPYEVFAGKDASKGLAKMSFEEMDLNGNVTGLGPFEVERLAQWEYSFNIQNVKIAIKDSKT